jgi:hypothetical protein
MMPGFLTQTTPSLPLGRTASAGAVVPALMLRPLGGPLQESPEHDCYVDCKESHDAGYCFQVCYQK